MRLSSFRSALVPNSVLRPFSGTSFGKESALLWAEVAASILTMVILIEIAARSLIPLSQGPSRMDLVPHNLADQPRVPAEKVR